MCYERIPADADEAGCGKHFSVHAGLVAFSHSLKNIYIKVCSLRVQAIRGALLALRGSVMLACVRHGGSCCTVLRKRVTRCSSPGYKTFCAATLLLHSAESTATTRVVVEFKFEHPLLVQLFVSDLVGVIMISCFIYFFHTCYIYIRILVFDL